LKEDSLYSVLLTKRQSAFIYVKKDYKQKSSKSIIYTKRKTPLQLI